MGLNSLTVCWFLIVSCTAWGFEFPESFGEDRITRQEVNGEQVLGRQNTQTAIIRYEQSPLNQAQIFTPMGSFEGFFLNRQIPALQSEALYEGNVFVIGNEVGDPLYQELESGEDINNHTPTIQLHAELTSQSLDLKLPFRWEVDLGFEQVDHMSSRSAFSRTRLLGSRVPLDSRAEAHSWFGENLPTQSFLQAQVTLEDSSAQSKWSQRVSYKQGYLWLTQDTLSLMPVEDPFNERPFELQQLYSEGHYENIVWSHQSVYAQYRYLNSINDDPAVSSNFDAGSIYQNTSRIQLRSVDVGFGELHLGGLHHQIYEKAYRFNRSDSLIGSSEGQYFGELSLETQPLYHWTFHSQQTFNENQYLGRQSLQGSYSLAQWKHLIKTEWKHLSQQNILAGNEALRFSNLRTIHGSQQWMDYSLEHIKLFGIHYLGIEHQIFQALDGFESTQRPELYSFKETLTFGIARLPRTKMKTRLSYEKTWGRDWGRQLFEPPAWHFYQNLSFKLPTGLTIQPVYSWMSSYQLNIDGAAYRIDDRHQLHLSLRQSLLNDRLMMWVEMTQLLSKNEELHPRANEDRFRTTIGARWSL